ncbi:MAG: glycerol-3-phosphate 1-O-acyltransferase PlsY [Cyanobacteriota bacterium]
MDWIILVLYILIAYLFGSIPTGYILVKQLKGIDIRTVGSGGTGATNVKRVMGTKYFVIVMLCDMFKGMIPTLAALHSGLMPDILPSQYTLAIIVGIAAVFGHSKSIFINFTGGKSVATSIGVLLAMCWQTALIAFIIWVIVVYLTRYVSLGSIIASFSTPITMWLFDQPASFVIFTLICSLYVSLYLHRANIKRLFAGTENKFSLKGEAK